MISAISAPRFCADNEKTEERIMKNYLVNKFLPMWAKETVLRENRQLKQENLALQQEVSRLDAYARGLRTGLRAVGRSRGGEK
jgi:hypothetical protein